MSDATIRVYVDSVGVDVAPPATVIEAISVASPVLGAAVRAGERIVTDSRGLPVAFDSTIHGGSILRVIPARKRTG